MQKHNTGAEMAKTKILMCVYMHDKVSGIVDVNGSQISVEPFEVAKGAKVADKEAELVKRAIKAKEGE